MVQMKSSRRAFVGEACAALGLVAGGCRSVFGGPKSRFRLGMAGYTLHSFKTEAALAFCAQHGFKYLCVKNGHLPFDATPKQVAAFRRMCGDYGVTPYGAGPIYMYSADEAKRYFDYTAALGVDLLVGVPGVKTGPKWTDTHGDRGLCEACSKLADEYRIRFAIHNHGANPKTGNPNLYPTAASTYEMIRDLSPRMGLCVDWAYTHADGFDVADVARKYRDRIFDGHVRCIVDPKNGSSGVNPAGRSFDYAALFAALRETGYAGCLGLELANAFPDHPEWIDESRDYFTGLM